jgi:hypothetical protein
MFLYSEADPILFNGAQNVKNCSRGILPTVKNILRKAHCFKLLNFDYKMFKESFTNRSVFKHSY